MGKDTVFLKKGKNGCLPSGILFACPTAVFPTLNGDELVRHTGRIKRLVEAHRLLLGN